MSINVVVWNEFKHEIEHENVKAVYPNGIHEAIAEFLSKDKELSVSTAFLKKDENHGLSDEVLAKTDVLLWWGHMAHDQVKDEIVAKVKERVLQGMGLIVLHSGHFSKIFQSMLGTHCQLTWREQEQGEKEIVWNCNPGHPITKGIPSHFVVPQTEMYGEPFGVPAASEFIFSSWYEGGETFRSGLVFRRGNGTIFYFSPGHETFPIYRQKEVQTVITNAVHYVYNPNKWVADDPAYYPEPYGNRKEPPVNKI